MTLPATTWRALGDEEDAAFRQSAREKYTPGEDINPVWHPVYIHECYLINKEAGVLAVR